MCGTNGRIHCKEKRKTNGITWPDFPSVPRDTLTKHFMTAGAGLTKTENGSKLSVFVKPHGHFKKKIP